METGYSLSNVMQSLSLESVQTDNLPSLHTSESLGTAQNEYHSTHTSTFPIPSNSGFSDVGNNAQNGHLRQIHPVRAEIQLPQADSTIGWGVDNDVASTGTSMLPTQTASRSALDSRHETIRNQLIQENHILPETVQQMVDTHGIQCLHSRSTFFGLMDDEQMRKTDQRKTSTPESTPNYSSTFATAETNFNRTRYPSSAQVMSTAESRFQHRDNEEMKYPEYSDVTDRRYSFTSRSWPKPTIAYERMAAAGLFYTGKSDLCRCFVCGHGWSLWTETDDPFIEHWKNERRCSFIRSLVNSVGTQIANSGQSVGMQMTNSEQTTVGMQLARNRQPIGMQMTNSGQTTVGMQMTNSDLWHMANLGQPVGMQMANNDQSVGMEMTNRGQLEGMHTANHGQPVGMQMARSRQPVGMHMANNWQPVGMSMTNSGQLIGMHMENRGQSVGMQIADNGQPVDMQMTNGRRPAVNLHMANCEDGPRGVVTGQQGKQQGPRRRDPLVCKVCNTYLISVTQLPCGHLICPDCVKYDEFGYLDCRICGKVVEDINGYDNSLFLKKA